ncbi:hypothetical protein [Paenibacillus polymyxa]|uniref:hypothetical protein n=1 Tax=Paenibacillus polymyxa TaxID=1406 RepID=UPI00163CDD10|nr:hypothetical protein [Paenibacillus polymyxa]
MKYGPHKPNLNAYQPQTTIHRTGAKMLKGWGWLRYNKVYNRSTFDIFKVFGKLFK